MDTGYDGVHSIDVESESDGPTDQSGRSHRAGERHLTVSAINSDIDGRQICIENILRFHHGGDAGIGNSLADSDGIALHDFASSGQIVLEIFGRQPP